MLSVAPLHGAMVPLALPSRCQSPYLSLSCVASLAVYGSIARCRSLRLLFYPSLSVGSVLSVAVCGLIVHGLLSDRRCQPFPSLAVSVAVGIKADLMGTGHRSVPWQRFQHTAGSTIACLCPRGLSRGGWFHHSIHRLRSIVASRALSQPRLLARHL